MSRALSQPAPLQAFAVCPASAASSFRPNGLGRYARPATTRFDDFRLKTAV